MPMNADILAEAVAAEFGAPATDFLKKFCEQIVLHIQVYGQVNNLIVVGTSPSGPVAGTANGVPGCIK